MKDHHTYEAGTRKKRPASRVFFFLPAFGRCRPSVSARPAKAAFHRKCLHNINIAMARGSNQTLQSMHCPSDCLASSYLASDRMTYTLMRLDNGTKVQPEFCERPTAITKVEQILEKSKRGTAVSNCNFLLENRKSCLEFWEHTIYSTDLFQFQSCDS